MSQSGLTTPLSNVQLEILKLFSRNMDEDELLELKRLLVKFLAEKAKRLANQIWEEKGWTDEDMDRLSHTHMRTPYQSNR